MTRGGEPYLLLTGPLFIGSLFNWSLLGTLVIQTYVYYSSRYNDSKWIKGLVVATLSLDIVQTAFATHAVWQILILGWGNPATFTELPWTAYTFPVMSGTVAALVQFFFSWRIWVLGRTNIAHIVAIVIDLVAVMQMIAGLVAGIQTAFIPIEKVGELKPQFTIWLAGSFGADVLIVVSMLWILHQNKGGISATNGLIDRLTVRVVHSGAVTAVAAGVELVLFILLSATFVHDTPALFLGKLYSNVLLANLNTRRRNDNTYSSGVITSIANSYVHPMFAVHGGSELHSTVEASATQLHDTTSAGKFSTNLSDHV
ncbi:hypothetical protein C8F04DRAFT_1238398 [Mycena alexandri]|uniref:DUF6534 domain-containing protein n=1 Tax=Mycena alexandri TaxID=1745969 RepID=A0AAD6SH89_9AGAR|nr:hypothetical protein C8F04DRAFT_1238398 [Mycena alexandri]